MRMKIILLILLSSLVIFWSGCGEEQNIEKRKDQASNEL
jgi:outer membrane lipoprotein-sorting protein